MDDAMREIFKADQNMATQADMGPIISYALNLLRAVRTAGATDQEAVLFMASFWTGMIAASQGKK